MSSRPSAPSNSVAHSRLICNQGCPRNRPRPKIPENAAPVTENQIGNQLKVNPDPLCTAPRAIQNKIKQSAPIADATHMVIIEELRRRCTRANRLMAMTFVAKTMRPVSFVKKSTAADKSEIVRQRIGGLLPAHRIA